jgi:hypothetical protein
MPNTTDLLINADDLGYSPGVNDAIFDLMGKGLVTSASLLANAPDVEAACAHISDFPDCSFGVHLNVTEFRPLQKSPELAALQDDTGEFVKGRIRRFSVERALGQAIFDEYCLQIEKLYDLGVNVSHIDSHHYVHSNPSMFWVLKRLQKRFGLRKVRISRNIYGPEDDSGPYVVALKGVYNFLLRNYYRSETTSGFTDFATFSQLASDKKLNRKSIEVHVHPGATAYADETGLLESDWRDKLQAPVRLVSRHELT